MIELNRLSKWVKHPEGPVARILSHLPVPVRDEWKALLLFGIILIAGAGLFFEILEDMVIEDPFARPDTLTYAWLQSLRSPALDRVVIFITQLGDTVVVAAMTLTVGLWLAWRKAWRALVYWGLAIGGGSLINMAIKLALQRARPADMHYSGADAFSFPSGHTTTNALLYGFLIVILARETPFRQRIPLILGAGCLVGLIAFSRLYLGAHWLSDVVGGLAFGSAWLALLALFYMWRPARPVEPKRLLLVAGLTLLIVGGTNMVLHHDDDLRRYGPSVSISGNRP